MVLLISVTGNDEKELTARMESIRSAVKKFSVQARIIHTPEEAEKYWTIRRQSFKLLHSHVKGRDAAAFVDDVIVRPEHMAEFLPKVNAILDRYKDKLLYTIAGHPGNGNFHIIPLADLKDPEVQKLIPLVSEEIYKLTVEYGGSITGEHNDGLIRTPYLHLMFSEKILGLFAEVKHIFDPEGLFNPHKKTGGSAEYSFAQMKKA
jgi:FAD/FMN-containing dehydrogenase